MPDIMIHGRPLGDGEATYIVFEAGPTHDGLDTAFKLIDVAAFSGADAIKFQILNADALVPDRSLEFSYGRLVDRKTGEIETVTESLWEILKRRELSFPQWEEVVSYCRKKDIAFFSTATNEEELEFLAAQNVETIKICSGDITYHHLLRLAARYDFSVQIDTGGATLAEVEQAIEVLEESGCEQIIINHCPSGYPARLESINLRVISTIRQMYPQYPVAFSDHSPGNDMDIAAVCLGAHMLEKTITLDRTIRSPEHVMSLEPHEAAGFVQTIRDVEVALGSPRRTMGSEERKNRKVARRSIYAARNLSQGTVISQDDINYARPGAGIDASLDHLILGRKLTCDIAVGTLFTWQHLA